MEYLSLQAHSSDLNGVEPALLRAVSSELEFEGRMSVRGQRGSAPGEICGGKQADCFHWRRKVEVRLCVNKKG